MLASLHGDLIRIIAMNLDVNSLIHLHNTCKTCKESLSDWVHDVMDWCNHVSREPSIYVTEALQTRAKHVQLQYHRSHNDFEVEMRIDDNDKSIPAGSSYVLYLQTHDRRKIREAITFVAKQTPQSVRIQPFSDEFCHVLQDEDTKLLHGIEHVYVPMNAALTDQTLRNVRHSELINICGCQSIQGKILPFLILDASTKLYNINWIRGYGVHKMPFGPHCDDHGNFFDVTSICKWMRQQAHAGTILQEV